MNLPSLRPIQTSERAASLSHLCANRFRIIATRKTVEVAGGGWSYTIPQSEVGKFRRQRDAGKIISLQGTAADGAVVYAKLARGY